MANEDSPSFSLGISQIKTQKRVPASNQVLGFTPDNFNYTEEGFSENRSKQHNDPEKLKILRQAFADKNQDSDMQMEDQEEIENIPNSPLNQVSLYKNLSLSSQELNQLDLPNSLTFDPTYHGANVAQAISIQQQSERTALTKFLYEFDDFSTLPNVDLLKKSEKLSKDKRLAGSSRDRSDPHISLDKYKVVHNIEMRDADKVPTAGEKKESLSKSDLYDIKSSVKTYVDMKFNDLQKLTVDHYT
ncbi:hypothetical protein P3S67_024143 [Capsicum chacoense]